ncbi:MAG: hypothetical protein ACLSA6_00030 [Holdemania massiliensis]
MDRSIDEMIQLSCDTCRNSLRLISTIDREMTDKEKQCATRFLIPDKEN